MNGKLITQTPFGPVGLIWSAGRSGPLIARIVLSQPELSAATRIEHLFPGLPASSCAEIDALARSAVRFLEGEDITFSLAGVDMSSCSAYQKAVLTACHRIPRGKVAAYRDLASQTGKPNSTRAVGTALARNPFPLIIPCHRVVRANGDPGRYGSGAAMKRALLEMEGIVFNRSRGIDPGFYAEEDAL